jgi:hypothetical protein
VNHDDLEQFDGIKVGHGSQFDTVDEGRPAGTDEPFGGRLRRLVDVLKIPDVTPELQTAVKAAWGATVLLNRQQGLQDDIIEESVTEVLPLYTRCACGNIWVTCPACARNVNGEPPAKRLVLPFNLEGLRKLTLRVVDRVKRRAERRVLTQEQRGVPVEDMSDTDILDGDIRVSHDRPDWKLAGRAEDDMIAAIDAKRGVIDTGNARLMRFVARLFTPAELACLKSGKLDSDQLVRLREKWRTYIHSR